VLRDFRESHTGAHQNNQTPKFSGSLSTVHSRCYVSAIWRWHMAQSIVDACHIPIGSNDLSNAWNRWTHGRCMVVHITLGHIIIPHHLRILWLQNFMLRWTLHLHTSNLPNTKFLNTQRTHWSTILIICLDLLSIRALGLRSSGVMRLHLALPPKLLNA